MTIDQLKTGNLAEKVLDQWLAGDKNIPKLRIAQAKLMAEKLVAKYGSNVTSWPGKVRTRAAELLGYLPRDAIQNLPNKQKAAVVRNKKKGTLAKLICDGWVRNIF